MIHYSLRCTSGHDFDGWFKDSAAFDAQLARQLVTCPECGNADVTRGLMAPAIPRKGAASRPRVERQVEEKRRDEPAPAAPAPAAPAPAAPPQAVANGLPDQVRAVLQRIRAEVERTSDYVGPRFAEEARRIHRGETEKRNIYGESTPEQAEALADEGIEVSRIPWVPRADG